MALKNRVHVFTWKYDGDEIQLQSNFGALENLAQETGMDGLEYIQSARNTRELVEVFYHLQFGTEYSRAEIHNAFFAEAAEFNHNEELKDQLARCVLFLTGGDKAVKLWEESKNQATDKKKK